MNFGKSPLGYKVYCDSDRWNGHICSSHPNMSERADEVEASIVDPDLIHNSDTPEGRHVYFGASTTRARFTRVVVEPPNNENEEGEVVTAFISDTVGENVKELIHVRRKLRR